MPRALLGTLAAAGFLAALVWVTLGQIRVTCHVCLDYRGRQVCEEATAVDRDEAFMQATTAACARLSNGVTDGLQCNATPPTSVRCSE